MNRVYVGAAAIAATLLMGCVQMANSADKTPAVSAAEAVRDLAPGGRLRVAINLGNGVLAQKDAKTGELGGVSVMLAKALGEQLHVPVDMTSYPAAGEVFDAMGKWDVAFLAVEPERAEKIQFSDPYVYIDGTYMVRTDSPYQKVADLDKDGVRISVSRGAAYDLYLTRNLKHAQIMRAPATPSAIALFMNEKLDAAAGVRQALVDAARGKPEYRVLADRYTRIDQAMAVPKGHPVGAAYIHSFLEQMKASGKVRTALDATGQDGAVVAPPAG